uniref:PB1 domain-containing protein n=1 Tax=Astyanax mexicanus TaxID=7994 RepID=A0A3B1JRT8_ASTMX
MASQNFVFHLHISTDIVRKLTLSSRPESVDELKNTIREKFQLDFDFNLSYQDPDFDGQLCSLVDIEELPQKAILKVIRPEGDVSSASSDDTVILPHALSPDRAEGWPLVFPVPTFSYEVELILGEGNVTYERTGKIVKLSKGQKHDILETLAGKMHSFKAYPNDKEVSMVAEALVTKHPCLKEPGSRTGWYGWKNSLKFKMGNYRSKLSRAGFHEVAVNSGKRSRNNPDKQAPHTNIKRPRRAEVNFLPNFPRGEDATSLEKLRLQIADDVRRSDRNLVLIAKLMQSTFALRRKEVISEDLPIGDVLERWPALKVDSQICAEFHRITNVNLKNHFYAELDRHAPHLLSLFRIKAGLTQYISLQVSQSDEPDIDDMPIGLLSISASSTDATPLCPERIAVVLEGNIVIEHPTLADAFVTLFGLMYVGLHLSYPKELANTFDFTQKVLMGTGGWKVEAQKNKLNKIMKTNTE